MTYRALTALCTSVLLLSGIVACSSETASDPTAERKQIEEAVNRHLAKRTDLDFSAMKVTVARVNVMSDDKAEATVRFDVGEGDQAGSIQLTYALSRTNGVWEVAGVPGANGQGGAQGGGHGQQVAPPAGGQLPAGHPSVGGQGAQVPPPSGGQLPSGHPPVN